MKIIYDNGNQKKVYVQKRDILYLKSQNERGFLLFKTSHQDMEKNLSLMKENEFISFEGEEAIRYFEKQKEIIDYTDYLDMTSEELMPYSKYPEDSYQYQTREELFFEKEGIRGLPYPICSENIRKLLVKEEEYATYEFYMSLEIPQLFFFKKSGEVSYLQASRLPYDFVVNCHRLANVHTVKENFTMIPSGYENLLLYMPLPEEKQKQEEAPKQKHYLKRFLETFKKTGQ